MDPTDDEEIEAFEYDQMYAEIGFFITQHSTVEIGLTALLAVVAGVDNLETFHTLTRGMDAKTKVRRLKELTKTNRRIPKDGPLESRLDFFADNTSDLRNKIAHSWILKGGGQPTKILFSNIARLPFVLFKVEQRYDGQPDQITLEMLAEHSAWLAKLQDDVISLLPAAKKGTTLELTSPRSPEPKELQKRLSELEHLASTHKHPRKTPTK